MQSQKAVTAWLQRKQLLLHDCIKIPIFDVANCSSFQTNIYVIIIIHINNRFPILNETDAYDLYLFAYDIIEYIRYN